jgi:YHS domain-containing protein
MVPGGHLIRRLLGHEGKSYYRDVTMLLYMLTRVLTLLAILGVLRFLWRTLIGWKAPTQAAPFSKTRPIVGELKQDPNCGTYISADISLKTRRGNEVLHFCSRDCQEEFLRSRSAVPN